MAKHDIKMKKDIRKMSFEKVKSEELVVKK